MSLSICVAGLTGNVGSRVARAVLEEPDLSLVAGVSRRAARRSATEVINDERAQFTVCGSVQDTLAVPFDILVDYTHPSTAYANAETAISSGRHVVVGTSGITDAGYERLGALARERDVGMFAAGNFSLTAALLKVFASRAARHLPTWEIIDYGSATKPDAPNGTARELAHALSEAAPPRYSITPDQTIGDPASRGASISGTQVHSVRVPGYYSSVEIVFGLPGERLLLRHDSMSYEPYVQGTLLAVRRVRDKVGLRRGLDSLLQGNYSPVSAYSSPERAI